VALATPDWRLRRTVIFSFGMEITAEGVETVEQLMFLCNLDCDDIQGYYFSRPLPVKEYEECLKEACM